MPFWYILVFLLTSAEVVIQWHQSGRLPIRIATSAVLWMLASLYSVTALVPIDNRIKSTPPPDWKTYRRRWDLLHRRRVVLLTIAFAFLIVGFVSKWLSLAFSPRAAIAGRSPSVRQHAAAQVSHCLGAARANGRSPLSSKLVAHRLGDYWTPG
jgi:hypothetical protein